MSTPDSEVQVQRWMTLLSRKWVLPLLDQLHAGPLRYNALLAAVDPITPTVLTATLRSLQDEGIVESRPEGRIGRSYSLTPDGRFLLDFAATARRRTAGRAPASATADPLFRHVRLDMQPGDRFASLRRELGITSFGLNLMRLEPGQRGRIHSHRQQEEVYVVLAGELTLTVEGEALRFTEGDVIRVAPRVRRQLTNGGSVPLRVLALGAAGRHPARDGVAWFSWQDPEHAGVAPAEVPLPDDVPVPARGTKPA